MPLKKKTVLNYEVKLQNIFHKHQGKKKLSFKMCVNGFPLIENNLHFLLDDEKNTISIYRKILALNSSLLRFISANLVSLTWL